MKFCIRTPKEGKEEEVGEIYLKKVGIMSSAEFNSQLELLQARWGVIKNQGEKMNLIRPGITCWIVHEQMKWEGVAGRALVE